MKTRKQFKVHKLLFLLAGMAMLACSQKEQLDVTVPEVPDKPEPVIATDYYYTFGLTNEAKSSFETNFVKWDDGDLIASYAKASKNQSSAVSVSNTGYATMTIKSTEALTAGDMVYAYAPYSSRNNGKAANGVTMEIPRNQISGSANAMPLVSLPFELTGNVPAGTPTEVGTLEFMTLGSIIKLNIYSTNTDYVGETIENVTFQAGAACSGSFTYDLTAVNAASMAPISGYTTTDVVVFGKGSSPVTVGEDKEHGGVFYIVVAPGTYGGTFIIRTSAGDYTYDSSGTERVYERGHIKPLNINIANTSNWARTTGFDSSIDSPREFAAFLAGTSSSDTDTYDITVDLDMTGYTITSASGFGGTLDGGLYTISNLTSSVPMFAENSGTISNLIIDETCTFTAGSNVFGALVAEDNGGTYSDIRNKASVTFTASSDVDTQLIIGGIIGKANGATLTSCTNSNAIIIEATGYSHKAVGLGGIVGYAEASTFDGCINRGPVTLNADYGDPKTTLSDRSNGGINVGGVLGAGQDYSKSNYCTFIDCQNQSAGVITLNHTRINGLTANNVKNKATNRGNISVGGILGRARGNMNNCKNFAAVNVTAITNDRSKSYRQNYVLYVGGLAGQGLWALSFNGCRNDGKVTVVHDGTWDDIPREKAGVGGICGRQDYDYSDRTEGAADIFANYCNVYGDIDVSGNCDIAVGGIFGINGKQIGNQVKSDCEITVNTRWAYVGGLVGIFQANPNNSTIKRGICAATISANLYNQANSDSFDVGGLIGRWDESSTDGDYSNLTQRDGVPCAFSGSISSTSATNVGIVIGRVGVSGKTITFGDASPMIQASGSFAKKDLSAVSINSTNVETYAMGGNDGATVTLNVEYTP